MFLAAIPWSLEVYSFRRSCGGVVKNQPVLFAYLSYMEQGVDRDIKKYFIKILNTFSLGFIWLFGSLTAGIYFRLAYKTEKPFIFTVIFYIICTVSFLALLRYYYRIWKK